MKQLAAIAATVLVAALASAAPASAAFEVLDFTGGVFDSGGVSYTQAGGHGHSASTSFQLPIRGFNQVEESLKDVEVDLPPGFVGNPTITPTRCTNQELYEDGGKNHCPPSAQVGIAVTYNAGFSGSAPIFFSPIYNMVPPRGTPAVFAFTAAAAPVFLTPKLRTGGDYGITVRVPNVDQTTPVSGSSVTLWGVPADPSHDADRGVHPANPNVKCPETADPECTNPAGYSPKAFLTNPSNCSAGVLTTTIRATSWQHPNDVKSASFVEDSNGNPTAVTGCDRVPFDPEISVLPTSREADGPTGLDVELTMPTDGLVNPDGIAQANLKRVKVTLPEGMTINPSSADGLAACSDVDLGLESPDAAICPEASKIGSVSIETPLLEEPLPGAVFIRSQSSSDPASGEMFRLAIVVDDADTGIRIKLAGSVVADPATGRLTTTFDDNPQVPFSKLSLRLKDGPRAPLAMPPTCGRKTIATEMSSWSAVDPSHPTAEEIVTKTTDFTVDCPGMAGFSPSFDAGAVSPTGGAFSPFAVRIDRQDGQEYLDGVKVELPAGSLAKLRGIPLCPEAQANAGTCGGGSRVGSAAVGAGPGSNPFFLTGQPVYLAGPYKGAPYSLSVATRAIAGPFDLGPVVVRQALFVDPVDAHITVVSDPLPTIVKGVPLRLRSVDVNVDRPDFTINPTSCAPKQIRATLHSQQGSTYQTQARFQVGDCAALAFNPRLALRLTGRKQTRTGQHPGIRAQVTQTGIGEAGVEKAVVRLPKSLALDPDNAQALCEFANGTKADVENHCPKGSIIGRAKASTPLLDRPLAGNVYFVKNVQRNPRTGALIRKLPMLVVALRGQVAINLKGVTSTTKDGRLVNTFAAVPDAPITRFNLNIKGGRNGILAVTRTREARIDLCAGRHVAEADMDGHNERRLDRSIQMKTPCTEKQAKRAKRAAAKRAVAARRG